MSMHLRGSSDMMRNEDEGWWTSRTGLEQKLIILSTILFIVCFALTITVIVYKKNSNTGECTTVAPPTTSVTDTTASNSSSPTPEPPSSSPVPESSSITPEASSPSPSPEVSSPSPSPEVSSPSPSSEVPSASPPEKPKGAILIAKVSESGPLKVEREMVPVAESSPLMALLKEAKRVNDVLDKHKEEKLRGA